MDAEAALADRIIILVVLNCLERAGVNALEACYAARMIYKHCAVLAGRANRHARRVSTVIAHPEKGLPQPVSYVPPCLGVYLAKVGTK